MNKLIALTGYAGSGKDEAAKALIEIGYERRCFGDTIKGQVDSLVLRHFGFSAFTEDRTQKPLIRRTLESWGEDNYDSIFRQFFASLPEKAVNTRLCRAREAREWLRRGGVVVHVQRRACEAETPWSAAQVDELEREGLITHVIHNNSTVKFLRAAILDIANSTKNTP
jgi:hypothetical protein